MKNKRHNNSIMIALAAILCLMAAFALTACETEQKTLEDYLNESPSAQQEIEESLAGLNNSDMDVTVSYDQNRIIITGQMKSTYKKRALKAMKKSYKKYMAKHLTEPMEKAVSNIESETGIEGVSIQVIINNGNGKEIWSGLYPQSLEEETVATEETAAEESSGDADEGDKGSGDKGTEDKGSGDKGSGEKETKATE